jgi:arylsulfatase A-like enzyme
MCRRTLIPIALGALALLQACGGNSDGPAQTATETRPNILMIMADDLGYSDIGAFGGEISTPNLDALVASGRVLTDYRVGAACSPTRSMLMTGTDHHIAGLGSFGESIGNMIAGNVAPWGATNTYRLSNIPDGYEGYLNDRVLAMPQLFGDAGYHTYMAGKWHLSMAPAAPADNGGQVYKPYPPSFPKAKGFEHSFALLHGGASHFAPVPGKPIQSDLIPRYVEDDQPASLPLDFYSSQNYTDKLISYLDTSKGDGKPFFAYLAYTAPHWPLHAPDADIAKYAGKYDEGYEVIRARRLARQKALGLIPADFNPNPGLDTTLGRPKWDGLTTAQKASEARKMEVYAAMVENMDRNIGRLVQYLKDTGRFNNTLIVFASDNGADGGPVQLFPNDANTDNSLANIGRPLSNIVYGERWAEVSSTPFRLWKGMAAEGGIAAPLVVHLPGQTIQKPTLNDQMHVSDLLPTFLEVAGIKNPGTNYKGRSVKAITGVSLLARLDDRSSTPVRGANDVLAGELVGSRYVIKDQWKLESVPAPFGDIHRWQLFDLRTDRGETTDLIASYPHLAEQLATEYDAYAKRVGLVLAESPTVRRAPAP